MKAVHWVILSFAFILATWFIYKTRETQPRVETTIDLNWKFMLGDEVDAQEPGFDDSGWRYLSLPHDWMIEQTVSKKNPSGTAGGYYPEGSAWYRKTLDLAEFENMDQFYLLFEGVQMNADIYLNGEHLRKQIYGYSSFYHDITSLVRRDTLNVIAVRTDCGNLPVDRWYSGGGIYRHVKLIATNSLHIPVWGSSVTSLIHPSGSAQVSVSLEVKNNGKKAQRFQVRYDVVDPGGRIVAEGQSTEYIEGSATGVTQMTFTIEKPELWSPNQPGLYSVNCYLKEKNKQIDHIKTMHGIRSAEFDPNMGFLLNGEKVMMKGVCLHHDGGALGAAVPMESWKRRLSLLKELGVNALRLAHNPHAPEVLDLCDRMGFLVIDEMYDKWEESWHGRDEEIQFTSTWETDLTNFIRRDRNHPSVVLWSVGNETMEQLNNPAAGVAWYNDLKDLVYSIDSTRQITAALHPGSKEKGHEIPSRMMHVSPVVSYNYRSDSFQVWHEQYPDLVFIATETKAYGNQRKEDYQKISFEENSWNNMDEFVAGQFIWAGIDYLGESAAWPDRGLRHGLLQTNGFIKPYAWYIGSQYREDPLVKLTVKDSLLADSLNNLKSWQISWAGAPLVDHWSFENNNSNKEVVIFTNCDKVDIQLNNKLIHSLERNSFSDGVLKANVPYQPGELIAFAYYRDERGKSHKVSDTLSTSHSAYALTMHPDQAQFRSDNRIVHITTNVVDSTGVLDPHSNHLVNYQLDGPGKIRVIDNGDPADQTPYGSASKQVRKGKQLLVLQAGSEPGDLIVHASADGLRSSKVKIKSKE
jgi:beta-galactosidase